MHTTDRPLMGLRFLVTRPKHLAEHLCCAILNLGGAVLRLPTFTILHFSEQKITRALHDIPADLDKVIFTSANAVQAFVPHFQIPAGAMVLAIGPGTAKALKILGIHAQVPPLAQFSSKGLLAMPELACVAKQNLLIVTGEGGKSEQLAAALKKRGAAAYWVATYRRKPLASNDLPLDVPVHAIISTSLSGLQYLWQTSSDAARAWMQQQRFVVVSVAMQKQCKALGIYKTAILTDNASDSAILEALKTLSHPVKCTP